MFCFVVEGSLANRKPRRIWPTVQSIEDGRVLLRIKQKRIRKGPLEKAGRSGQYSAQHCAISLLWAQLYVPLPESDWVFTHTNAFPQQRAISPYLKMGFKKILNYLYKEGTKKKKKRIWAAPLFQNKTLAAFRLPPTPSLTLAHFQSI